MYDETQPRTTREVLRDLGRVHLLSENLRRKIISDVTLAEVRTILAAKRRAIGGITRQQMERVLSRFLQDNDGPNVRLPDVDWPLIMIS